MLGLRMLATLGLIALLTPFGGAAPAPVEVPEAVAVPLSANTITVGPVTVYVLASASGAELWRETNDCAGLQKIPQTVCGSLRPADTKVASLP